jgi:hypothetical protein
MYKDGKRMWSSRSIKIEGKNICILTDDQHWLEVFPDAPKGQTEPH